MIRDPYFTNSLLLHNKIPPSVAASNRTYLLSHRASESGPSRCGFAGSAWSRRVPLESAVRLLAGVGIAEWFSGTSASVPSPQGTAGGRSHFLATMWTLLHRPTGLLPACCSLPPKQGARKRENKKNIQTNTTFYSQCLLGPVSEVMTCHHSPYATGHTDTSPHPRSNVGSSSPGVSEATGIYARGCPPQCCLTVYSVCSYHVYHLCSCTNNAIPNIRHLLQT